MTPKLKKYFEEKCRVVDKALDKFLPQKNTSPVLIHESMRYSIFVGGKRLRPILVMQGAEICGGSADSVIPTACAMELIHTYSLVHDDLPAMDDDDLRRGYPTNHKVYGEDMAILTGDALLTDAFNLIALNAEIPGISLKAIPEVIKIVAKGAGTNGMIGGQVADIKADQGQWKKRKGNAPSYSAIFHKKERSPKKLLEYIHLNKTAALIVASLEAGAVLSDATQKELLALKGYGECIGLAFQVRDDVLDQIGDKKKLGKKGSDTENDKLTFPALYGIKESMQMTKKLIEKAHQYLKPFPKNSDILHELADFIGSREH